ESGGAEAGTIYARDETGPPVAIDHSDGPLLLAAAWLGEGTGTRATSDHFNGKISAPALLGFSSGPERRIRLMRAAPDRTDGDAAAAWNLGGDHGSSVVEDRSGNRRDGRALNMPTRAVTGHLWDGTVGHFDAAPEIYQAMHFHDDDLEDAGWEPFVEWTVPDGLPSGVYAMRLLAIITFLSTGDRVWLFWHQVVTGWTAAALLWASLVFVRRIEWRTAYGGIVVFPVAWSFVAIYVLDSFLWAAGPMIAFLSLTTAAAGWAFLRYHRLVRSPAARFLAVVLFLWALHHLDYPILRARGAWNPWGYYIDITFEIAVGLGILFLVLEDLDQGLASLTALSGELQGGLRGNEPMAEAMLRRALSLRGVHGSALWIATPSGGHFVQGAGVAALWPFEGAPESAQDAAERVRVEGVPRVARSARVGESREVSWPRSESVEDHAYTAALPVLGDEGVVGALVVVGEARDPFTVLDNRFLLAFGQQVGAALATEELHRDLQERTEELERLQARMIHQHEEERNRLWRELHDETAQVLAALNLQLGVIAERSDEALAPALERARTLLGEGIKGIRSVTRDLRPVALDDLGLLPSLRALARDFSGADGVQVRFTAAPPAAAPSTDPCRRPSPTPSGTGRRRRWR
ncbi:MAG: histidine kinase, partial [Longimicrobiales bacterium]|nr:histidine kinase [Longimicrobiales bacterium]